MSNETALEEVLTALELMVDTFDHCGLRGLALTRMAKKAGWTAESVQSMSDACDIAKMTLVRSGRSITGIIRNPHAIRDMLEI